MQAGEPGIGFAQGAHVARAAAAHSACIARGATLAVTEMTPWPPSIRKAAEVMSSPLYSANPAGARSTRSQARSRLPVASWRPTMLGTSASAARCRWQIGDGAAGNVVEDQRQFDRLWRWYGSGGRGLLGVVVVGHQ